MKNKTILKVIVTTVMLCIGCTAISAQGFAAIMEITEKLEKQLD